MGFETILGIVGLICAVWVIIDVWGKQRMGAGMKILWTVLAIFFSILTAIVYFFMVKKGKL